MEYFMVIQPDLGSTAITADSRLPNFRKFSLQTAANITGPETGGCASAGGWLQGMLRHKWKQLEENESAPEVMTVVWALLKQQISQQMSYSLN